MDAIVLALQILALQPYAASCTQTQPRPLTMEELQTCSHLSLEAERLFGKRTAIKTAESFYQQRTKSK